MPQQQPEQSWRDHCVGEEELQTPDWEQQSAFSGQCAICSVSLTFDHVHSLKSTDVCLAITADE